MAKLSILEAVSYFSPGSCWSFQQTSWSWQTNEWTSCNAVTSFNFFSFLILGGVPLTSSQSLFNSNLKQKKVDKPSAVQPNVLANVLSFGETLCGKQPQTKHGVLRGWFLLVIAESSRPPSRQTWVLASTPIFTLGIKVLSPASFTSAWPMDHRDNRNAEATWLNLIEPDWTLQSMSL